MLTFLATITKHDEALSVLERSIPYLYENERNAIRRHSHTLS
jgi:hypothetical protein